uniref:lysozyme n=1 Tax=Reticulitermes speratus TaxID=60591 RepID=A0A1V1FYT8_9NEOP
MSRYVLLTLLICSLLHWAEPQFDPVSTECLQCICEATSNCDFNIGCSPNTCGPYAMTWGYWNDGQRPVLDQDSSYADGAYTRCANDKWCAERAVQNYMLRYGHDCNGDEEITCYDYAAIHRSGSNNCGAQLDSEYVNKLVNCMTQYSIY